jgi:hypothetical protein
MPDRRSHKDKALHNESFLNALFSLPNSPTYPDWTVTTAFYIALHYVDAYLARYNIHPTCHSGQNGRNALVAQHLGNVFSKYMTLYKRSRYARYVPYSETNINVTEINTIVGWIAQYFKPLP